MGGCQARGDADAVAFLDAHDDEVIGASTVVLSEIYRGLLLTQGMSREEAVAKYEWVEAVPFTTETAAEAATIYVELRDCGGLIDRSDIYVAGTARALGVPLVTDDDHFAVVENLAVERY